MLERLRTNVPAVRLPLRVPGGNGDDGVGNEVRLSNVL